LLYDPFDADLLQGWRLDAADCYQELVKNERGWCWCQQLGLWLGSWQGELKRETAPWLCFYDPDGNLILLPEEQRDRERQRAELAEGQRDRERQEKELAQQQREAERQARLDSVARLLALGLGVAEVGAALDLSVAEVERVRDAAAE